MRRGVLVLSVVAILFSSPIQAATEFLRFEGNISGSYGDGHPGHDASLNLKPNQWVYFDFQIDTDRDVSGKPDSDIKDYFPAFYLWGTIGGSNVLPGETVSFPEGMSSWVFVKDTLMIGTSWDSSLNPTGGIIDNWGVGDRVSLMSYSYFWDHVIGDLTLTYRGSGIPPSVVPIPAASWLLISGVGLISFAGRKRIKIS
jgi:hypothetical protein